MEELIRLLKSHDWTFEYSDDHSAWKRGNAHKKLMIKAYSDVANEFGSDVARTIWNTYAFDKYRK